MLIGTDGSYQVALMDGEIKTKVSADQMRCAVLLDITVTHHYFD